MTSLSPAPESIALPGALSRAVTVAWRAFARHGEDCTACAGALGQLAGVPDDPYPAFDLCCADGEAAYVAWAGAKAEFVEHLRTLTRPWGMAGRSGAEAELRAAALTALSAGAALDIFATIDTQLREAKIYGIIAAHRRMGGPGLHVQRCQGCQQEFKSARPGERWCSKECRLGPTLANTDPLG